METSTWELPSLPLLRKPPSAKARSVQPAIDPGKIGRTCGCITVLPFRDAAQGKTRGWLKTKKPSETDRLFRFCATPRPGACGSPPTCSIAATTVRGWRGAPRSRAQAGVPLIAVNDVLYHHPDRRELQDVLTCIREHLTIDQAGRRLAANAERYLKPPAEMARLFRECPEAIEETLALGRTLTFSLDELSYEYPDEMRRGLRHAAGRAGASGLGRRAQRYPDGIPDEVRTVTRRTNSR